jgi:integrase
MLRFCFRHGLRVSELVALRWTDIVWTDHAVIIQRRKQRTPTGTRPNIHPLAPDEMKMLKALYVEYGAETDYVFAGERRGPDGRFTAMTTSGFSKMLPGASKPRRTSLISGRTPFAMGELADAGRDAFLIRDALGHANVATSNSYVAASPERLRGVL